MEGGYIIEIWKDIIGYEGYYQISNMGNVKSLARNVIKRSGVIQPRKERIMDKRICSDEYYIAKLTVNNVSKSISIHRLVAIHFIPNPDNLPEVNHIDCNRQNNCVDNLEWCTHGDNVRYSIKCGNHICCRDLTGINNPNYGNHILSEKYKNDKDLAIEKLSRPYSQNGRAVKIEMYDENMLYIDTFDWIGGVAEYLIKNGFTTASVDSIRTNVTQSIKNNKPYRNHYYKKVA